MKIPQMEKELNNCLVIFELTGLQYFSLKTLTKENADEKISTLRKVGAFFLLVLLSGFMICFIYSGNSTTIKTVTAKNILMFVIRNSMNVGLLLIVLTSLTQSYSTTRSTKKIFFNIKEMTEICCREFNICVDFKRIKKAAWKKISVILLFFGTVHGMSTFFQAKDFTDALPMLLSAVPTLFLLVVAFKFVFYVDMINSQLTFLDGIIKNLICNQPSKFVDSISFRIIPVVPEKQLYSSDTMRKLRVTRKMFNLIYENGIMTNSSNGLSILVLLIDLVISFLASGYEVFVIVIGDQSLDRIPQTVYVIVNCVAVLIAIISYSHATSQIVNKFRSFFSF